MNIGSPAQSTDFALDVMGRYVCNTFEEARANSDPVYRASATDRNGAALTPRGDMRPFDFIIVGGGTFGAALAEHLWYRSIGRSERILVLEAGPFFLPEHQQNVPSINLGQEVWGTPWKADPNLGFAGLAFCIGGRSIWWGGWSPRLLDSETPAGTWPQAVLDDLNAKNLPGVGTGYFRQSGRQIGVTQTNDFIFGELHNAMRQRLYDAVTGGSVSDAVNLTTLPEGPMVEILDSEPSLEQLAQLAGLPAPDPALSDADRADLRDKWHNLLKLEAPLAVQAHPEHAGFFPLNKFSTVPLLIKATRLAYKESGGDDVRKRVMVVPRCHVQRLNIVNDPDGRRVDSIVTERGLVPVSPNTKVIVALGTIESTRLALLSFGADGRIGTNLMAHLRSNVTIRVPREAFSSIPGTVQALQTSALFMKGRHKFADNTVGHFHFQITASGLGKTGTDAEAELFQKIPDIEFLDQHLQASDTHVVITIRAIGEMQPNNSNSNITLDLNPANVDFNERKAYVNLQPSSKDWELWDAMDKASDDLAHAFAGGHDFEVFMPQGTNQAPKVAKPASGGQPRTDLKTLLFYAPANDPDPAKRGRRDALGTTHHEAGSLRMGDDPNTSVTDANCRFHGVKNAYVVGPALFPTIGSPNPMLTGIALARRLGDHLLPPP